MPRFKYFNTETNQWEYASSNGTNGKDGISPTISIEETDSGVMIEATNANGTNQIGYVLHGEDGFSPTVTIAENIDATITPDGVTNEEHTSTTVTITDKNGEKNFTVSNGKSAYKYAVEGGYTGTEEDFKAKLTDDDRQSFVDAAATRKTFEFLKANAE